MQGQSRINTDQIQINALVLHTGKYERIYNCNQVYSLFWRYGSFWPIWFVKVYANQNEIFIQFTVID